MPPFCTAFPLQICNTVWINGAGISKISIVSTRAGHNGGMKRHKEVVRNLFYVPLYLRKLWLFKY